MRFLRGVRDSFTPSRWGLRFPCEMGVCQWPVGYQTALRIW